jgi:hypothetical protein
MIWICWLFCYLFLWDLMVYCCVFVIYFLHDRLFVLWGVEINVFLKSWFSLSSLVYRSSLKFVVYFYFPILKELVVCVGVSLVLINYQEVGSAHRERYNVMPFANLPIGNGSLGYEYVGNEERLYLSGIPRPVGSPDLTVPDFILQGYSKVYLYRNCPHTKQQLERAFRDEFAIINHDLLHRRCHRFFATFKTMCCKWRRPPSRRYL